MESSLADRSKLALESVQQEPKDVSQHSKELQKILRVQQESADKLAKEHSDSFNTLLARIDQMSRVLLIPERSDTGGSGGPKTRADSDAADMTLDADQTLIQATDIGETGPETAGTGSDDLRGASQNGGEEAEAAKEAEGEKPVVKVASERAPSSWDDEDVDMRSWGERMVTSTPFEMTFALLIVLNTLNMCAECEYQGWGVGHDVGIIPPAGGDYQPTTAAGDQVFHIIEISFGIVFTLEVILKLAAMRMKFWTCAWNVFDFTIICFAWFDLLGDFDLFLNPMLLRLVRLVRLLRLVRGLSAFEVFDNLSLMVRGIKASTPVLIWVVVLVFPMIASCALGMNYTVVDFIMDETKPREQRVECYQYFGTFTKGMLSMFEVTFSNFVPICRFLYDHVDEKFALFFMAYKLVMGIAVLRIIYGVFLHVTFACATSDEDTVIAKKNRDNKRFARRMNALFEQFDSSGDGSLSKEEFLQIVEDPRVKTLLSALELDIEDAELVFDLTDTGDGQIGAEEMVYGFSRLKGAARSVDILALTKLTKEALSKLDMVLKTGRHSEKKIAGLIGK